MTPMQMNEQELRRLREGCARLLGCKVTKKEPLLSASDGCRYYYQGQIHYWMDDYGPQREYFNPLSENSPDALKVLKWCIAEVAKNGRNLSFDQCGDQWFVWDYDQHENETGVLIHDKTLEIALCRFALELAGRGK